MEKKTEKNTKTLTIPRPCNPVAHGGLKIRKRVRK
jgi:hypothetical protein